MRCEYCESEHDGSFASGRFCKLICSKGFSSKNNREERNEKIRKTLTFDSYNLTCKYCKKHFLTKRKHKKFCSRSCSAKCHGKDPAIKEKLSLARIREIEKGNIGYGLKTEYNGIRCDSALEYAFLKQYLGQYPEAKIERFKGYIEGEGIKYQPDFIIDNKIIVEVKYNAPYVGHKLSKKWKTYVETQEAKKNLLFNSNQEYLWITEKDIGNKFYRQCIKEVKAQKLCKTLDQHAILDLPTPCKH